MSASESEFIYDVFISYSHADRDWVEGWLVPELKAAGLRVCIDEEDFAVGEVAIVNMTRAVKRSRKVLLVLTPEWVKSEWTRFESLLVLSGDPIGLKRRVLPLMLKKCEPPDYVSIFTHADFTREDRWEKQLKRIINAINDDEALPEAAQVPDKAVASRAPLLLPQLDVTTFTGRAGELELLEDLLIKRKGLKVCSIVGLTGTGGIGKSALAYHFATLHRDKFPEGIIGLRVDGKEADWIAREFAKRAGVDIEPEDERDAATIMQQLFAHRRMLLILDNADDPKIERLRPGGDRCAVIITTRSRELQDRLDVPEEGRIELPPLPEEDSLQLLERLIGKERVAFEREAAEEIINLVGNLPLALRIVGATLQNQKWRKLADYRDSLSEERERLAKLNIRGDSDLNVEASFSLSLELLDGDEQDFFACLSVCARDGFSVRGAMAAGNCDEPTTHERLGRLYGLSLLNLSDIGEGRFVFHSLVRLFAGDLAARQSLGEAAAERHARFFIELVKSSDAADRDNVSVLSEELNDILVTAEWLLHQRIADYEFVILLEPFLQQSGHWQQAIELMTGFLTLAESIEDRHAVVQLRIQQAKYLTLRGDWMQADSILAPVADIVSRIESPVIRQRDEAMWLNTLGGILQRQGNFNEAIEGFQRSYNIFEQMGDQRSIAVVLNSLGGSLQRLGRFDEAVDAFQRSYDLLTDVTQSGTAG